MSSYYITDAVTATPRVTATADASTAVAAATATLGVAAIAEVATSIPAVVATPRIAVVSVGVRDLGGGGTGSGRWEILVTGDVSSPDFIWGGGELIYVGPFT